MLERIEAGRTDLVIESLASGKQPPDLLRTCAYYGDVTAVKLLLNSGVSLTDLGEDRGILTASFHGHWRLVEFLLECSADPNYAAPETGETALHSALCKLDSLPHQAVVAVLLKAGANPNTASKPGAETGAFMRDVRTRGETPLHRAAAFGNAKTIQMLLDAGANREARDVNGDSPLSWASWHLRPASILRLLCYGEFCVREGYAGMEANLIGGPVL